jgi:hypothetical protein
MMDKNSFEEIHRDINKFNLYKHYAYEKFLAFAPISKKARFLFYFGLNENIYNKTYDFHLEDIEKCYDVFKEINKLMTNFLIDGQIYGYYEEDQARIMANLFNDTGNDETIFLSVLDKAGLSKENLSSSTYRQWIRKKKTLEEVKSIKKQIKTYINNDKRKNNSENNRFIYIYWDNYTLINRVISFIFKEIVNRRIKPSKEYKLSLDVIFHNNIYLILKLSFNNSENNHKIINTESLMQELITKINETIQNSTKYYEKEIDSIGNRLYYLIKNMIEMQYLRTRDMTSSAISHLYSDFYTADNYKTLEKNSQDLKESEYKYFLNLLSKIQDNYNIVNYFHILQ